jgi:hypothetical protein
MEDSKEFTKVKSKGITSRIKTSRQASNASQNTPVGAELPMPEKDEERLMDLLARVTDVMNSWSILTKLPMPKPFMSTNYILLALPVAHHVITNSITSDGKHVFLVNGKPVTSIGISNKDA